MTPYTVLITTCSHREEAQRISRQLVEQKLAACVQLSAIDSIYVWDGAVQQEPEIRLVIKTRKLHYDAIQSLIVELHSYEVPQLVELPISDGLDAYLDWIGVNTEPGG